MRFTTVSQWLAWQETLNPREIDLGLERVRKVAQRLNLLQPGFKVITVAGTNGKGSCVALLSAIYSAAGYRTGVYSSPHLLHYQERIRLNEQDIDAERLCQAFQLVDDARADTPLTYFEFGTLAALLIFAQAGLDIAILEVGLGGRLDAVNVLDADVAMITSIGIDHCDWLGNDREQIGREKAGIMRSGRPLVCGDIEPPAVIAAHAEALGAPVDWIGHTFCCAIDGATGNWSWRGRSQSYQALPPPRLVGTHQYQNAAACLAVLERLAPVLPVKRQALETGLRTVRLPGRFQRIKTSPEVIVDVAHNPQAAQILAANLATHSVNRPMKGKTLAVFSALLDKDITGVVAALHPRIDRWYIAPLGVARAAPLAQLTAAMQRAEVSQYQTFPDLATAYHAACTDVQAQDRVLVFGSFYTVASVLELEDVSSV